MKRTTDWDNAPECAEVNHAGRGCWKYRGLQAEWACRCYIKSMVTCIDAYFLLSPTMQGQSGQAICLPPKPTPWPNTIASVGNLCKYQDQSDSEFSAIFFVLRWCTQNFGYENTALHVDSVVNRPCIQIPSVLWHELDWFLRDDGQTMAPNLWNNLSIMKLSRYTFTCPSWFLHQPDCSQFYL